MKTSILTLLAAAGFTAAAFAAPVADATPEGEAKIISYNIRLGVADDGANSWEHRREATLRMLEREAPTVFGIQEGYLFQVKYIEENLPQYDRVGVGRDDGKEGGEIMAVFYLRDRYDLLDHGDLWLSETPDRVSRGWDGACNRTMTWVHLREKATGKEFFHFNSHFDHIGTVARAESAKLLIEKVAEIAGKTPAFCTGDFNSNQQTNVYNTIVTSGTLVDSYARTTDKVNADWPSYNGYKYISTPPAKASRIDHIFVTKGRTKVQSWAIVNTSYSQKYPSDHFPVVIEWSFAK